MRFSPTAMAFVIAVAQTAIAPFEAAGAPPQSARGVNKNAPSKPTPSKPISIEALKSMLFAGDLDQAMTALDNTPPAKLTAQHYYLWMMAHLFRRGDLDYRLPPTFARMAMNQYPGDPDVLAAYAFILLQKSKKQEAENLIDAAIKAAPANGFVHAVKSALRLQQDRTTDARNEENQSLKLEPKSPFVLFVLAKAHEMDGKKEASQVYYTRWMKAHPDHALAPFLRACAVYDKKNLDPSFPDLCLAMKLNPHFRFAAQRRGRTHYERKRYQEAVNDWNVYEQQGGKSAGVFSRRAASHAALNQDKAAIEDYTKAIAAKREMLKNSGGVEKESLVPGFQRGSDVLAFTNARAELYLKVKDYTNALADARTVSGADPKNAGALNIMRQAAEAKKDYKSAVAALTKLIAIDPDVSEWYQMRSAMYRNLGNTKAADDDFVKAERIDERGSL